LSSFIFHHVSFHGYENISFYLKGGAGCSINCKCEDCRNPFGRKGNTIKELDRCNRLHDIKVELLCIGCV